MTSHCVQKWIECGEEVKTNLAALIDSHLLVNSGGHPDLEKQLMTALMAPENKPEN